MNSSNLMVEPNPVEAGAPPRARWRNVLRWTLLVAITVGLLALLVRRVDWAQFLAAMKLAKFWQIAVAGAVAVSVCMWGCIERLWVLLGPLPHGGTAVGRLELASIHYASCAAHNLLPAPAGEVVRTVQLRRRHGYSVGVLVAAQLVEKVIESLGLGIEVLVVALLSPLPARLGVPMYVFAGIGAGGAIAVLLVAQRYHARHAGAAATEAPDGAAIRGVRGHVTSFVRRLSEGMYLVRAPRIWAIGLFWSIVADLANAATVGLVLSALGIHLPVSAWFLVMLAARAAGLFPSTPGQFGVQEAAVVLVLSALGVDQSRAFAVAVLHHVVHFVPVTLAGLYELRRQWAEVK
ncbi:MAG TPA: lysylphosphatidylglycerol synthase transmembrane domain-containing protein [Polyangia bacterium]|nr:lysylphosphatidylglycerol synthase transmembrane domain-containing protein [Polyangia bacterium]